MKKLISILLVSVLLSVPVYAADYSSMSLDDLVAMRDEIQAEIDSRTKPAGEEIPAGVYVCGEDIKAGSYIISRTKETDWTEITVYADATGAQDEENEVLDVTLFSGETCSVNLKEGNLLIVGYKSAEIQENNASWKP